MGSFVSTYDLPSPIFALIENFLSAQEVPASALYVLATPIGNLADITLRALFILSQVNVLACEDTRVTAKLLRRYHVSVPLIAAHQHNEREVAQMIVARLQARQRVALVSDAGTPGIADPGARIVQSVLQAGYRVIPIPGACAAMAALSVSGVLSEGFYFLGFLPRKAVAREKVLRRYAAQKCLVPLILYEVPHRLLETVGVLEKVLGGNRSLMIARELTKRFETIHHCLLEQAHAWLVAHPTQQKGEFVLLIGAHTPTCSVPMEVLDIVKDAKSDRILSILLAEMPLKQAVSVAMQITGQKKNLLYARALHLSSQAQVDDLS